MNNHNNYVYFNCFLNQNNFPMYSQQQLSNFVWNGTDCLNQRELYKLFYPNNNFLFVHDQYNEYHQAHKKIFTFKKKEPESPVNQETKDNNEI